MIRVAVIDDHPMVRAGLREFIGEQADMQVVAEASSGRHAVGLLRRGDIDVFVVDISMPDFNGIDTLKSIRTRAARMPVLMLSSFPEEKYALMVLRQGASGYLNKGCDPEDIAAAIRIVHSGHKYISAAIAEELAEQAYSGARDLLPHEALSERELQVFLRLAHGEKAAEIGNNMSLGTKTITTYRSHVMEKLQLRTNSELTYYAVKYGLLQ